jgi:hypothetical protein
MMRAVCSWPRGVGVGTGGGGEQALHRGAVSPAEGSLERREQLLPQCVCKCDLRTLPGNFKKQILQVQNNCSGTKMNPDGHGTNIAAKSKKNIVLDRGLVPTFYGSLEIV